MTINHEEFLASIHRDNDDRRKRLRQLRDEYTWAGVLEDLVGILADEIDREEGNLDYDHYEQLRDGLDSLITKVFYS